MFDFARYNDALRMLDERASGQHLAVDGRRPLIDDAVTALRAAVDEEPRDMEIVRERVVDAAADALRVIRAMVQAGEVAGLVNPTADRLSAMIDDYAPNTANARIGNDDPLSRFVEEIELAAIHFVNADPKTVSGSTRGQLESLFRIVGLAAQGLAVNGSE